MLKMKINKKIKLWFVFFIVIFLWGYMSVGITHVVGKSMESTIDDGEFLLVDRLYKEEEIKRGDIVILDVNYKNEKTRIIKRIIAKSGDILEIKNNNLYINNALVKEPYIKEIMTSKNQKFEVPKGNIFVMGDNRNISLDSRDEKIGYIDFDDSIYGKAIFSISDWKKI